MGRSIIIRMRRRGPQEKVEPFRRREHSAAGEVLQDRLAAWAAPLIDEMKKARPEMPAGVEDRAADCWEPLLAVADAAGGHWPEIARAAAVALVASARDANLSMGILLLEHCRTVFGDAYRLPSEQLLLRLHDLPESPWRNVKGKPLDDRGLAYRLRKYEIKPKVIRFGLTTARGYLRADFEDVWPRYLPPPSPQEAQQGRVSRSGGARRERRPQSRESKSTLLLGAASSADSLKQPQRQSFALNGSNGQRMS